MELRAPSTHKLDFKLTGISAMLRHEILQWRPIREKAHASQQQPRTPRSDLQQYRLPAGNGKTAIFGIGATLVVLVIALLTPMRKPMRSDGGAAAAAKPVFGSTALYLLSSVTLLYTACEFGIWNWLPKYLIATGTPRAVALNILSLGFACGLLCGRIAATSLLWRLSPLRVITVCSLAMAATTYLVLHPMTQWMTWAAVFCAGITMAPMFPTTIAIVGRLFKSQSATAIGFAITCGFSGLMLSSPLIGWLSGSSAQGIGRGLLLLPALSLLIFLILICSRGLLHREEERESATLTDLAQSGA